MVKETIRQDIFERFEGLLELVESTFPKEPRGLSAFKYSLELYIRSIPELGDIDGWASFNIIEETKKKLHVVGLIYIVPCMSKIPIEALFLLERNDVEYSILTGTNDKEWQKQPDSKKLNFVESYVQNKGQIQWQWHKELSGEMLNKL